MKDVEHAGMMLEMARKDLKALEGMLDKETFVDEIFGFHAQQSIEKALKAWLSIIGAGYPKIHDLEELFSLLEDNGISVSGRWTVCSGNTCIGNTKAGIGVSKAAWCRAAKGNSWPSCGMSAIGKPPFAP